MRRSRIGQAAVLSLLYSGALGLAAHADDVYLKNGRSFEGVIVTSNSKEQIRIRLAFGELGLSSNLVDRIVLNESGLERFLRRRRALVEKSASAEEWLDLALWANGSGLDHGYREAVLVSRSVSSLPKVWRSR